MPVRIVTKLNPKEIRTVATENVNTKGIHAIRIMATAEITSGDETPDRGLQLGKKVYDEYMLPEDKEKFSEAVAKGVAGEPVMQHRYESPATAESVAKAVIIALRTMADDMEAEMEEEDASSAIAGLRAMLEGDAPDPETLPSDQEVNHDAVQADADGEVVVTDPEGAENLTDPHKVENE